MPQNKQISQALENRSRLLEDFTQGQLERINKYSECCTSARDRDRENFGWDFVGGLSTDEGRPYQNYSQYLNILRRSVGVFEDSATMQGIAAKYISYVLGKEGAKYTVEKKPAKDICSLEELTSSNRTPLTFDQSDIKKMNCIIDVVSHTANDWLSLQKDGLWEYFRTGEMIRRTSELVKEKFPEVDIVTSFQVRPPNTTRSSLPTTNRSITKINAEYGIRFVSGRPRTYYILDEGGENPIGHPVERIQHVKFGSQKKNPRAVPPFFVVRENADGIKQYEFGIRESFLARSLNSVIWELPPASATDGTAMAFLESRGYANEDVKSEARVGLPDGGSGYTPDRSLTGEVHTTSKVVYPSPNLGADEVISLIKMEQTMIGLVVCMADYLSTGSSDTGNRATLQESGDPFTAAIIQGRTLLAKTDAELFWRILQIWFGWNENQLIAAQMQLEIKSNFSEIVKEDESKIANAASILVTANIWSKAQARRRTKVDPDQMKREIELEKKEEPTPAQQQLQNGEQNGNGQPFEPKLDSPSEDEQTPSTPAEQVQNRRPQGTNPASPSNRSATEEHNWEYFNGEEYTQKTAEELSESFSPEKEEDNQSDASFPGLVEHTPGGKEHDQQRHGRKSSEDKSKSTDQTKTEEFKRWFSGSKIVDEDGEPLIVWHGGTADKTFDPSRGGEYGIYVTPRERYGRLYGDGEAQQLYISMSNPKVVEGKYEISPKDLTKDDIDKLVSEGHDGIVVVNKAPKFPEEYPPTGPLEPIFTASEIVAFRSEQVKSATKNRGTFDPDSDDITESISEGEPITEEVLEEFLGEVDNTGEQVSHNTVLENLQRAGYKIPENWQSRLQEHTPGGQDHDQKTHGRRNGSQETQDQREDKNEPITNEGVREVITESDHEQAEIIAAAGIRPDFKPMIAQVNQFAPGRGVDRDSIYVADERAFSRGSFGNVRFHFDAPPESLSPPPEQPIVRSIEENLDDENGALLVGKYGPDIIKSIEVHQGGTWETLSREEYLESRGFKVSELPYLPTIEEYRQTIKDNQEALFLSDEKVEQSVFDYNRFNLEDKILLAQEWEELNKGIRESNLPRPKPQLQEALDMINESLGLEDKEDCPHCQGTGLSGDDLCTNCEGTGNQQKERQEDDLSTQPNTES